VNRHHAPFDAALIQAVNEHQFGFGDAQALRARCPNCTMGVEQPLFNDPSLLVAHTDGLRCLGCDHHDPAPKLPPSVTDVDGRARWAKILFPNRKALIDPLIGALLKHPALESLPYGQALESDDPTIGAVSSALRSLRRYALLCEGVETRPGRTFEITSDWASVRDCCPPPGWLYDKLYHLHGVKDPRHPAYGVDWHIVRMGTEQQMAGAGQCQDGFGRAHYWRYVF